MLTDDDIDREFAARLEQELSLLTGGRRPTAVEMELAVESARSWFRVRHNHSPASSEVAEQTGGRTLARS